MKNYFIIILSFLVIFLSGFMLYDSIVNQPSKQEIQEKFNQLKTDYETIQKDLEDEIKANEVIDNELLTYKKRLEKILSKSTISNDELMEAKDIMGEISKIAYSRSKYKIKKLETENIQVNSTAVHVVKEKEVITSDLINTKKKVVFLENNNVKLDKMIKSQKNIIQNKDFIIQKKDIIIQQASQLTVSNFVLKSFKVKENGKEVETDKASKIDRVKASFEVNNNFLVSNGVKTFYVQLADSQNNILKFTNRTSGTFINDKKQTIQYSDKVSFNYQDKAQNIIELVWDNEDFSRGDYLITVYSSEGKIIGKATKSLR